jgi:hypothetical protein
LQRRPEKAPFTGRLFSLRGGFHAWESRAVHL